MLFGKAHTGYANPLTPVLLVYLQLDHCDNGFEVQLSRQYDSIL